VNEKCEKENKNERWKCMFAEHLLEYIDSSVFIIESSYDSYSTFEILNLYCTASGSL
jgi:O-palmitoleoyl-L-serine hydrolase